MKHASTPIRRIVAVVALVLVAAAAGAAELEVRTEAAGVGVFGLEVVLGSACAAPDVVTLGPPGPLSGTFEACETLDVSAVVVGGAETVLRAGAAIALGNDFMVAEDTPFRAELDADLSVTGRFIQDTSPIVESVYNAHFSVLLDAMTLADGESLEHFTAYSGLGAEEFKVTIRRAAGENELILESRHGGGYTQTPPGQEVALAGGWNEIVLQWASGAGDGQLLVSVNDAPAVGLSALDNPTSQIEWVQWGAIGGDVRNASGVLHLDAFSSWR